MPFCRKPIQWIFFLRSGSRTMVLYPSIMRRTAMRRSFLVTFICRFRRRWCGGQTSTAEQKERNGSIATSMLCQVLFTAPNVGIYTTGLHGTIGAFYGLAVLYSCGVWIKEVRCTDHLGIGSAGRSCKGDSGSIGQKGCIPACFREEYQRGAGK